MNRNAAKNIGIPAGKANAHAHSFSIITNCRYGTRGYANHFHEKSSEKWLWDRSSLTQETPLANS